MCNAHTEVCTTILDIVLSLSISTFENIIPQCLRMYLNLCTSTKGTFALLLGGGGVPFLCALCIYPRKCSWYTKTSLRIVLQPSSCTSGQTGQIQMCVIPLINFPLSQTIMMQLHSSAPNLEYGTFFFEIVCWRVCNFILKKTTNIIFWHSCWWTERPHLEEKQPSAQNLRTANSSFWFIFGHHWITCFLS